jgi:LmbE family N-acetylglucosaminyl deacetylase
VNIVCIGAHPDDAEFFAGGSMALFAKAGHSVLAVSLTNGDIGHHAMGGGMLAQRRMEESRVAAQIGGYESLTLDNHDGELLPDLNLRKAVARIIRNHNADIVFTHRPNDYHPDHRYTSQAVQDAAFMVTVPQFCPDTEALRKNPLFLYFYDPFTFPAPFRADIAVALDGVMETKWRLLDVMTSQFYEWLPWLDGTLDDVPPENNREARFLWLKKYYKALQQLPVMQCREALEEWYGDKAYTINYAEMFQVCEYGAKPDRDQLLNMFTF